MGIKIKYILLFVIFISIITFGLSKSYAKTPKEASSQIIKVGIMNNGFKSLSRDSITIYGTSSICIAENETTKNIANISANNNVTFTNSGSYILCCTEDFTYKSKTGFIISACNGQLGVRGQKRAGKEALYRGSFKIEKNCSNKIILINLVELEQYLRGVVPNEMPSKFGVEALKAQAVAARNYAITPRTKTSKSYDVVDSVASQVYFGYNTETETGDEAVEETYGIIALYNHLPILALYSSCAGGYTENFSYAFSDPDTKQFPSGLKPYLLSKPDIMGTKPMNRENFAYEYYTTTPKSYDINSKYYRWTREWDRAELENVLKTTLPMQSKTGFVKPEFYDNTDFGTLKDIKVIRRGNSGKIIHLDIETTNGKYRVSKELVIRRLFTKDGKALPSANVVFKKSVDNENNIITMKAFGGGYGHGVGMSQHGAHYMAKELKKSFEEILRHYYTGIYLGTIPIQIGEEKVEQYFYPPSKNAVIVINDRKSLNALRVEINEKVVDFDLGKFYNIQKCELNISEYLKHNQINSIVFIPSTQNKKVTNDLSKGAIKIDTYVKFF